ncbi:MAG: hypothetical protein FJ368_01530 [Pelagibacterales bacterium]|nr:hypothetical protein [Pelagibacterales bacterium]
MTKTTEAIVIVALMLISFFVGVKCSDSVKSHISWLSETNESDVELPELNENAAGVDIIDEAGSDVGVAEPAAKPVESNFSSGDVNGRSEANEAVQP